MTKSERALREERSEDSRRWEDLACSRGAAVVAFGWGFAEATFFFMVPDVWIGAAALFNWRCGLRAVGWSVLGALAGGAAMYTAGARVDGDRTIRYLDAIPAISPEMIARVAAEMRQQGPVSMLRGPLRGTPYKIYALTAGQRAQPVVATLLWTVPARGARFLAIAAVAAGYGALARRRISRPRRLLGPYLLTWGAFYAWYFRRYGF